MPTRTLGILLLTLLRLLLEYHYYHHYHYFPRLHEAYNNGFGKTWASSYNAPDQ